eukprot:TRINITY_DN5099_c0_g3_i2.p1 TRINITY_DN5099_c0_g3~~TRINITY_DN5099_c0_g3_i2.p1  ORF type:complete len:372 (+),score=17.05 TRINITY_DN5099_c0_g3_i2:141-1256(+)
MIRNHMILVARHDIVNHVWPPITNQQPIRRNHFIIFRISSVDRYGFVAIQIRPTKSVFPNSTDATCMAKVRQHEFYVSEGVTICKHCGVTRERRHEEECDERVVHLTVAASEEILSQVELAKIVQDLRSEAFEHRSGRGSSKLVSEFKQNIKRVYRNTCCICNRTEEELVQKGTKLSVAHLIPDTITPAEKAAFSTPYITPFNPFCMRNFICLCGAKDERGTCHHYFDTLQVAIQYGLDSTKPQAIWYTTPEMRTAAVRLPADDHRPYRRALAWHARQCIRRNARMLDTDRLRTALATVTFSDKSHGRGESADTLATPETDPMDTPAAKPTKQSFPQSVLCRNCQARGKGSPQVTTVAPSIKLFFVLIAME